MKMSCNGCRVLRKGCSEFCVLRPCLQWIKTAESQGNATIFLAKYYGRTGLTNLITRVPEQLRPDIFRSLLFDACGRIVNPIHGSLGLALSGKWGECQTVLDSILRGSFPTFRRGNSLSPDRKIMLPMEGVAFCQSHRSMKDRDRGRGRLKGFSHAKPKRNEQGSVPICNYYSASNKYDDPDTVKETVQNLGRSKFNGEYVDTYSTFPSGQEQNEFHPGQPRMVCRHDLIGRLKSTEAVTPAFKAVELGLTLGSQSSCSPTPR